MKVLRPAVGVLAFYDGRIDGQRYAETPNWVDPWALSLGICSYAIVDGDEALVYDTHVSCGHARGVRDALEAAGVTRMTVVLSHWHLDHIAGTAVFADCEIIANERTAEHLAREREAIERGTLAGPPAIDPLILPTRVFSEDITLIVGRREVDLVRADIHSDDATLLWLAQDRILLAGDTLEDTVTYVDEPQRINAHLAELDRIAALRPATILPSHGDSDVIAAGGYPPGLITATQDYLRILQRSATDAALRAVPLRELIADALEAGHLTYHPAYEAVHTENIELSARM